MPAHLLEHEWTRQARLGDRAAFTALVDQHWEGLRRWLFGLTGRLHVAEDITQEAFVRAWSGLSQLKDETTFRVWLYRIARNCLLDTQRGPRGIEPIPLPSTAMAPTADPSAALIEREGRELLSEAVTRLASPYREAYLLWTQEDFAYFQIAQVLGITEETARWRVCKARQMLLHELRAYLEIETP